MQDAVRRAAYLRDQAEKCVRLANSITDDDAAAALRDMAMKYEMNAKRLEANGEVHPAMHQPPPDHPN